MVFFKFLKPPGLTSHDVVEKSQDHVSPRLKVGHGGTPRPPEHRVLPILKNHQVPLTLWIFPKYIEQNYFLGITTDSA